MPVGNWHFPVGVFYRFFPVADPLLLAVVICGVFQVPVLPNTPILADCWPAGQEIIDADQLRWNTKRGEFYRLLSITLLTVDIVIKLFEVLTELRGYHTNMRAFTAFFTACDQNSAFDLRPFRRVMLWEASTLERLRQRAIQAADVPQLTPSSDLLMSPPLDTGVDSGMPNVAMWLRGPPLHWKEMSNRLLLLLLKLNLLN